MRISFVIFLFWYATNLVGMAWQQKIDYDIHCSLDDQHQVLSSHMTITYHNNAPHDLRIIKLHTWMNAFSNHDSPFARQLDHLGSKQLLSLSKENEGGYRSLKFYKNNQPLPYHFIDNTQEILDLDLLENCPSGQSVSFEVEYLLDIPKNISRGGHLGQSYQMTQWYPKVALYDSTGWHSMPYLELGEYFNEFGDYHVTIELSHDYIIAATGTLDTKSEINFLNRYADSCDKINLQEYRNTKDGNESKTKKIIEFSASHVIDFAWFADKSFLVNKKEIIYEDHMIQVWSFYYPHKITAWKQASTYAVSAIKYFNKTVGQYPYPQVSIVECDRNGTDGMEYPMITLIDKNYNTPTELEKVIVHEVGHNWFQAIIATDERSNAWMDEGLITYYEHRYAEQQGMKSILFLTPWTINSDYEKTNDFTWYLHAARNRDAPSIDPDSTYSIQNYVESIYEKPAKGIALLEKTIGHEKFDSLMHSYYDIYKFHHPTSDDLLQYFTIKKTNWFSPLYLKSNRKVNVKIESVTDTKQFKISHNAEYPIPVEIAGYYKDKKISSTTIFTSPPFEIVPVMNDSIEYLVADPDFLLPEIFREDNILRINSSIYAPKKTVLHLLPGLGHSMIKDIYLNPSVSYNFYDGLMPGLAFHNLTLPPTKLQFASILSYGLRSHKPTLLAGIEYTKLIESSPIDRITLSTEIRSYSFNKIESLTSYDRYLKLAPKIKVTFKPSSEYSTEKEISFRTILIHQDLHFDRPPRSVRAYIIHELRYDDYNSKSISPHAFNLTAELGHNFTKLYSTYKKTFPYRYTNNRSGDLRIFAGIASNTAFSRVDASYLSNGHPGNFNADQDYKFDELLFGRSESTNPISQQIFEKDGGLYSVGNWPASQHWMVAASYRSMIPGSLPLRPYVQFALYPRASDGHLQFIYTSGVSVIFIKNILEVNFPFFESRIFPPSQTYGQHNTYLKRCTFQFNLKALSPFKWIDRISS